MTCKVLSLVSLSYHITYSLVLHIILVTRTVKLITPLTLFIWYSDKYFYYFVCLFLTVIYFNWRLITLPYCGSFCHTLTWISDGCTCVPHPEPPSSLPPHLIPQGHPRAQWALSTLSHASNLDWQSIHICKYTWFNAILSNHPTLAFSHRDMILDVNVYFCNLHSYVKEIQKSPGYC